MSTLNTNAFVSSRRGGSFQITDDEASTTYTVSGIDEDSISFAPGMYAAILDTENGQPVRERRGDKQRSRFTIRFKQTRSMLNASSLLGLLLDQVKASDDGLLRTFVVIWRQTDHSGDATGESVTLNNCVPVPGSVRVEAGADYNTVSVEFVSRDEAPTWGTF